MTKIDDGGPAFPTLKDEINEQGHDGVFRPYPGMTLRDWFAGQAMAGLCAVPDDRTFSSTGKETLDEWRTRIRMQDASYCYALADAMLAARKEGGA